MCPKDGSIVNGDTVDLIVVLRGPAADPAVTLDGQPQTPRVIQLARWDAQPVQPDAATSTAPAGDPDAQPASAGPDQRVLLCRIALTPGEHVVAVGAKQLRLFGATPGEPGGEAADRPVFRPHPPRPTTGQTITCSACHAMGESNGQPVLLQPRVPEACLVCHDRDELSLSHAHRMESLALCQMCHEAHGSSQPSLLRDARDTLCAKCHE